MYASRSASLRPPGAARRLVRMQTRAGGQPRVGDADTPERADPSLRRSARRMPVRQKIRLQGRRRARNRAAGASNDTDLAAWLVTNETGWGTPPSVDRDDRRPHRRPARSRARGRLSPETAGRPCRTARRMTTWPARCELPDALRPLRPSPPRIGAQVRPPTPWMTSTIPAAITYGPREDCPGLVLTGCLPSRLFLPFPRATEVHQNGFRIRST